MNKKLNLGVSLILAFSMILGFTGPVFAQTPTPPASSTDTTQKPGLWQSLAQALQMTLADLQAALKEGKTIAQLAAEKGLDPVSLVTTLTARLNQRLQQAVSDGKMTQDEADQKLKTLQSSLNSWFTTGTLPAELKALNNLRQADKVLADALGMSVKDLNTAIKGGKTIAQLAQEKGVSLDSLVTAVTSKRAQALQKAVQDGKLTQDQADKALSTLKTGVTQWFNTGKRPDILQDKKQVRQTVDDVAKQLGMTADELKAALKSGKTLAQLAQEKGVSLDSLVTTLDAQRTAKIQQDVQSGKITQDQANQMLEKLKQNLTKRLENGKGAKNKAPRNQTQATPQADPGPGI